MGIQFRSEEEYGAAMLALTRKEKHFAAVPRNAEKPINFGMSKEQIASVARNEKAILALVMAEPGVQVRLIGPRLGVSRYTVDATLDRLTGAGRVNVSHVSEGKARYVVVHPAGTPALPASRQRLAEGLTARAVTLAATGATPGLQKPPAGRFEGSGA